MQMKITNVNHEHECQCNIHVNANANANHWMQMQIIECKCKCKSKSKSWMQMQHTSTSGYNTHVHTYIGMSSLSVRTIKPNCRVPNDFHWTHGHCHIIFGWVAGMCKPQVSSPYIYIYCLSNPIWLCHCSSLHCHLYT